MSEVLTLFGGPSSLANNGDLIEQLEELLDRARAGHITAMGMAFVNSDGSVSTRWSGGDQAIPMIAAVSLLQHEFLTGIGSRA
jgi:hypothetical protein